uniref:Uncharacterized protein n=1 Tax=Oryza glumipatula TaxID=40148 RepID=A0A0E0A8I8_9ORYZ
MSKLLQQDNKRRTLTPPNNIDQIVTKVDQAYRKYPLERANQIFPTQQGCVMEIMKHNGG